MRRGLVLLISGALAVAGWAAVSPWPGVLVIRAIFDHGAQVASDRLVPLVPAEVTTETLAYDPADPDALLDIYRPPAPQGVVVVWVHGGGFVSGRRGDVSNYLKILAGQGFIVVNVDYTIAPAAQYPTPLRQLSQALSALDGAGLSGARMVLAGDSAGAQIAGQMAALLTNPDYARRVGVQPEFPPRRLAGVMLFCGVYDIGGMGQGGGLLGWFVQTTGWAYSGRRDWREAEDFGSFGFLPALTGAYPPAFVSAGNADPLGPQSVALAAALRDLGVPVTDLFFPPDHRPELGHEYQFDVTTPDGNRALTAAVGWLRAL